MRKRFSIPAIAGVIVTIAGCSTSDAIYHEGVTSYAGDAIAANTMLQMVDPWQYGVQFTDLETPAVRPSKNAAAADSSGSNPAKP